MTVLMPKKIQVYPVPILEGKLRAVPQLAGSLWRYFALPIMKNEAYH